LQIRPDDWVSYLFPELKSIALKDMPTDMVARIKRESLMDSVKLLNDDTILQFEPMGYYDAILPYRMLRYRADIWEYTSSHKLGAPSIKQVVIYFLKEHDHGHHYLYDTWGKDTSLDFSYKVLRIWEIDSDEIIKGNLTGLYPILPLTKHRAGISEEEILTSAIDRIQTVNDTPLKNDLMTALSLFASERFSADLIKRLIGRSYMIGSTLIKDLFADELAKAKAEAATEAAIIATEKANEKKTIEIIEMATELLKDGDSIDKVVRVSKLSNEKVIELKESLQLSK
jgi:predicted transposase YdaD